MPTAKADVLTLDWMTIGDALSAGLEDMLIEHWEEVALDREAVPLAPDWAKYQMLERAGVLKSLAAMRAGRFIGYNVFFVQPTIHYSTSLWALNDILYLKPSERVGMAGARLIREAERRFRDMGVVKVLYHSKLEPPEGRRSTSGKAASTVGDLLLKLGYRHIENVYAKML